MRMTRRIRGVHSNRLSVTSRLAEVIKSVREILQVVKAASNWDLHWMQNRKQNDERSVSGKEGSPAVIEMIIW